MQCPISVTGPATGGVSLVAILLYLLLRSHLHECLSLTLTPHAYEGRLSPPSAWLLFASADWSSSSAVCLSNHDCTSTVSSMVSLLQSSASSAALDWRNCPFDDEQVVRDIVRHFLKAPAHLHDILLPFALFATNRAMNTVLKVHLDHYHPHYLILTPPEQPSSLLTPQQIRRLCSSPADFFLRTLGLAGEIGESTNMDEIVNALEEEDSAGTNAGDGNHATGMDTSVEDGFNPEESPAETEPTSPLHRAPSDALPPPAGAASIVNLIYNGMVQHGFGLPSMAALDQYRRSVPAGPGREAAEAILKLVHLTDNKHWLKAYTRLAKLLAEELDGQPAWKTALWEGKLLYCALEMCVALVPPEEDEAVGNFPPRIISSTVQVSLFATFLCHSPVETIPPAILYPIWKLAGERSLWIPPVDDLELRRTLYERLDYIASRLFPLTNGPQWGDLPACIDRWRRTLRMTYGMIPLDVEMEAERAHDMEAIYSMDQETSEDPPCKGPNNLPNMIRAMRWWANLGALRRSPLIEDCPHRDSFLTRMTAFLEAHLCRGSTLTQTQSFHIAVVRTALANLLHRHQITLVGDALASPWPLSMLRTRWVALDSSYDDFVGLWMQHFGAAEHLPVEAMQLVPLKAWGGTSLVGQPDVAVARASVSAGRGLRENGRRPLLLVIVRGALIPVALLLLFITIAFEHFSWER